MCNMHAGRLAGCVAAIALVSAMPMRATAATVWTDDFESYSGTGFPDLGVASGGIWSTGYNGGSGAFYTRWSFESFAARPDGGGGARWAGAGSTGGNIMSTRPLGASYSTGVLSISGWFDSRSDDGNTGNQSGIGLASDGTVNVYPAVWARYLSYSQDLLALQLGGASGTSGDAYGTAAAAAAHTNPSTTDGNQWQHVKLEVDLDAQIARMYADSDRAGPADAWVQVGGDVSTGPLTLSHAVVYTSRDGNVDDLVVEYVPEPAALAMVGLGMALVGRRSRCGCR